MPKTTLPEKLFKPEISYLTSRFEISNSSDTIIHENPRKEAMRGSPSLVGRGIANPMSERTRGFEIPWIGHEIPTPRAYFFVFSVLWHRFCLWNPAPYHSSRRLYSVTTCSNAVTISSNVKPFALIIREILIS